MDEDVLGFLDGPKPGEEGVVKTPEIPVVAEAEKPVTGATPEAPAAVSQPVVEGAEGGKDTKYVPLPTFLDMRDKLKEAEARLKELEPVEGAITPPDPAKNPGEYLQFRENMVHLNILNERMNFSEKFAVKEHGKELVDKARDWATERFKNDPAYEDRVMNEVDPYEVVIADFQRHQVSEEFNDPKTVEEFRAWKAGKQPSPSPGAAASTTKPAAPAAGALKTPVQPQRAASAQDEPPPVSIADAPSQGGNTAIPVGSGQAFDSLFRP